MVGFAWIHIALLLASGRNPILVHNAIDTVIIHAQQHGQLAMLFHGFQHLSLHFLPLFSCSVCQVLDNPSRSTQLRLFLQLGNALNVEDV